MSLALNHITVSVHNVLDAVAFYKELGLHLIVQSPHYARFVCPDGLATFSVHVHAGIVPVTGTTVYFECAQLDKQVIALKQKGYVFEQDVIDQPWHWREAYLRDPSGNLICLYFAGETRVNPEWRLIESKKEYFLTPALYTAWLDSMQAALSENSAAAFQKLFTVDARLLESPFAAPVFGPAKIKEHWDKVLGLFANVSYNLIGVQGEIGYAQLESTWGATESVVYSAMLALRFNSDGLCKEVVIWGGPTLSRAVMMKSLSRVFSKN